jgi:hypothetical protein
LGVRDRADRSLLIVFAVVGTLSSGCGRSRERALIVTTNDVIAKTSPCGCHTPKGGFARRAAFMDSVRAVRNNRDAVLALDAGGFFPVVEDERDAGAFTLAAMARMGVAAAGVGANDLRFGYSYLREHARAAGVPLLAANLERRDTHASAFERWRLFHAGGVAVGAFSLMPESADLGPARDTLVAASPENAARAAVDSLRAAGAQVISPALAARRAVGRQPGRARARDRPDRPGRRHGADPRRRAADRAHRRHRGRHPGLAGGRGRGAPGNARRVAAARCAHHRARARVPDAAGHAASVKAFEDS